MKKINFENLPSTNTPINATNLNQIQSNVEEVFNGAETMGNIVVNDIRCKNLFNINGERIDKYSIISTVSENTLSTKCTGAWSYLEYYNIKVKKGQTYTVSYDFSNPSNNTVGLDIRSVTGSSILGSAISTDTSGSKTFTFIADDDAVNMRICSNNTEYVNENTVTFSNIQIEKGNIATEYTPYKSFDGTGILLSKFASAMDGFTIIDETIYKQGNHYFGTIIVKKDEGEFGSTADTVITLPITIPRAVNSFCCLTNSEWQANIIGYLYISASNSRIGVGNFVGGSYNIAKIEINLMSI